VWWGREDSRLNGRSDRRYVLMFQARHNTIPPLYTKVTRAPYMNLTKASSIEHHHQIATECCQNDTVLRRCRMSAMSSLLGKSGP
jgi:hypothetical protein